MKASLSRQLEEESIIQNTETERLPDNFGNDVRYTKTPIVIQFHSLCHICCLNQNINQNFLFTEVIDLKWEYPQDDFVDEISMKEFHGFLETWFDFITLNITSKGVIVDKTRFEPLKVEKQ